MQEWFSVFSPKRICDWILSWSDISIIPCCSHKCYAHKMDFLEAIFEFFTDYWLFDQHRPDLGAQGWRQNCWDTWISTRQEGLTFATASLSNTLWCGWLFIHPAASASELCRIDSQTCTRNHWSHWVWKRMLRPLHPSRKWGMSSPQAGVCSWIFLVVVATVLFVLSLV